jgi:RHS repeat-associated protein
VQEFNSKGEFVREFGGLGAGNGAFSEPVGIAVSSSGNVYVADSGNNRIEEFNSKGEFVRAFGSEGTGNGQFVGPRGVAVDGEGHVWTIEGSGFGKTRVQEFSSEGVYISQFGSEGTGNGQFKGPGSIAADSKGNVWVADTQNNRVQEFKPTGEFVRVFGSEGTGNGQFKRPLGLAFDSEGDLWVADMINDRVQRFTSEGAYLSQFGTVGNGNGQFAEPEGIATDSSGNIWAADTVNNRVQEWSIAPATTYAYNQAGDLTSVTRSAMGETPKIEDSYAYNGDGLRTSETIGATTHYLAWDTSEGLPIILNDGTYSYIYGPNGLPVEQINSEEKWQYLHHDQQGSTRLITGPTGTVEGSYTYSPYGAVESHTGTATTPLGYDGQYTNSDTGLIYLRARDYDPSTAQFVSVDPAVESTHATYTYALDSPLGVGDPTGLIPWGPKVKAAIAKCQSWKHWYSKKSPYYGNKNIYSACQDLLSLPSQVYGTGGQKGGSITVGRKVAAACSLSGSSVYLVTRGTTAAVSGAVASFCVGYDAGSLIVEPVLHDIAPTVFGEE